MPGRLSNAFWFYFVGEWTDVYSDGNRQGVIHVTMSGAVNLTRILLAARPMSSPRHFQYFEKRPNLM